MTSVGEVMEDRGLGDPSRKGTASPELPRTIDATRKNNSRRMADRPNDLELSVMELLLSRPEPGYDALREQLGNCWVKDRKMTGVGFYTRLEVDPAMPAAPREVGNPVGEGHKLPDDVYAEIERLDHGAGFALWLEAGCLSTLEGYAFADDWPIEFRSFTVRWEPVSRGRDSCVRNPQRL
jgi:hypothetical protein